MIGTISVVSQRQSDREESYDRSPPSPPGIRITYHGGSPDSVKSDGVDIGGDAELVKVAARKGKSESRASAQLPRPIHGFTGVHGSPRTG